MKINRTAQKTVQSISDAQHILGYLNGLLHSASAGEPLSQMSARAILRAANMLDDALINDFQSAIANENGLRLALYDLLAQTETHLGQVEPLHSSQPLSWESLLLALFSSRSGYDLKQYDVSSPPAAHTPAGIVLHQTVQFMKTQSQRSATERDRMARQLAYAGTSLVPGLNELAPADPAAAAAPPDYRTPVPVRYHEYNQEVQVTSDELDLPSTPVTPAPTVGAQIKITLDDIPAAPPAAPPPPRTTQPRPVQPRPTTPRPTNQSSFSRSLRDLFRNEKLKTTRLRIVVQEYPDGPAMYGLQVAVSSKSIKSYVAGTTDRHGRFLCELPVRVTSGLTYDIDVTWPPEWGGNTERKSITINADRTEFNLPFYKRHTA